jgi:protein-tyrosine-phosphatase
MKRILFVCTANICRSPMATGLFKIKIMDTQEDWVVESAGTWAVDGNPAADSSQLVVLERGGDISTHVSRAVSHTLLRQFNLILTMEKNHKEALQIEFPDMAMRIYMLSEMIDRDYDIKDPIGRPINYYRQTASEIEKIFDYGFLRISQMAEDPDDY